MEVGLYNKQLARKTKARPSPTTAIPGKGTEQIM